MMIIITKPTLTNTMDFMNIKSTLHVVKYHLKFTVRVMGESNCQVAINFKSLTLPSILAICVNLGITEKYSPADE
jgi:hypothetical protein